MVIGKLKTTGHQERIEHLLEALKEARIYAGAEFEACCNEMEHGRAIYFSSIRDMLATHIRTLGSYQCVLNQAEGRCPLCGKKTSKGKVGGKICFDCVNRKRAENGKQ